MAGDRVSLLEPAGSGPVKDAEVGSMGLEEEAHFRPSGQGQLRTPVGHGELVSGSVWVSLLDPSGSGLSEGR